MSFNITIGRYGGFYIHKGNTFRICLGWIAFTFMKMELEDFADKQFEAGIRKGLLDLKRDLNGMFFPVSEAGEIREKAIDDVLKEIDLMIRQYS